MKCTTLAVVTAIAISTSGSVYAGSYRYANYTYDDTDTAEVSSHHSFVDEARVLKTCPIYETVTVNEPETQCWNEQVHHSEHASAASYTPVIAGGILGGVAGNQFGSGKGKDVMTVAGMLLGGSIGNDYRRKYSDRERFVTTEKRCQTVDNYRETKELVGYNVKYHYRGQNYWTRMSRDPGESIRVNVSVEPVEY